MQLHSEGNNLLLLPNAQLRCWCCLRDARISGADAPVPTHATLDNSNDEIFKSKRVENRNLNLLVESANYLDKMG
jgi:hypothetical protein